MAWCARLERNADESCCKQSFRRALEQNFVSHLARDALACGNILQNSSSPEGTVLPAALTVYRASPASRQVDDSSRSAFRDMFNEPGSMFAHYSVPLHQSV
jgi:hypothetical protein